MIRSGLNFCLSCCCLLACIFTLAGCATQNIGESADSGAVSANPWAIAAAGETAAGTWKHQEFPGKRASIYRYARIDGRDAMAVHAASSVSMLRQSVGVSSAELNRVRFSWKVPTLITSADLTDRNLADSPVRLVLAFEGDRSRFSARDAMLSELAHALTGEPMPYATLMYVWCNYSEPGTVLTNTRTSRIRKLVLESGPRNLNRWLDYERDVRADFIKAFGEEPGALVSIGIMTDTDNTGTNATAWYGPVRHVRLRAVP